MIIDYQYCFDTNYKVLIELGKIETNIHIFIFQKFVNNDTCSSFQNWLETIIQRTSRKSNSQI